MHIRNFALTLALLTGLTLAACAKRETPEQRVRAVIIGAEQAVEKKDISQVRGFLSERYTDEEGRDRRAVEGILRLYLLRNEAIHLLTRIDAITVVPPGKAEAVVYVAMAARPITQADTLSSFNANLYRFELSFAEEDKQWRVVRAAWRPAEPADFIYEKRTQ
jgi:hypothetical protein